MTLPSTRPRLAIIGGGGVMGRLFTRLFCTVTRELYLFDYFDASSSPSILSKALDDLRVAADASGLRLETFSVSHSAAPRAWSTTSVSTAPAPGRALALLAASATGPAGLQPEHVGPSAESLSNLVDRLVEENRDGCTVVAGLPSDADELLPRADVTLLAIGIEGKSSLADAIRFYAPWLRPGSLVVDLGSTKTRPLETLCQELDPRIGILGAHPLFGPTVSDLTGLIVAVVDPPDNRAISPWRQWFLDRLAQLRLIVTPTNARQHDEAMSFVQALAHFTLLSFAYTFVRLNQDPADLLPFRTPVFEPLLYLAARVAYLARSNPDTYRAIQIHCARPDAREAFLDAAKELLAAIEMTQSAKRSPDDGLDPLSTLFAHYGSPWSPDRRDRRDRQRREHLLEMGARLVDGLNQLRQEVVAAAGQVRAIEERRVGQPPRVVIGLVDLDLLDPGKQDVASRIRLRPINLVLGSVQGGNGTGEDLGHDLVIPLARARVLSDHELLDWLLERGELVQRRACDLLVPDWFDRDVLTRLVKGMGTDGDTNRSRVWDVTLQPLAPRPDPQPGLKPVRVMLSIVLHPADIVSSRQDARASVARDLDDAIRELDQALDEIHRAVEAAGDRAQRDPAQRQKDVLKHRRKKLIDLRTTTVDREVRRLTRARVQAIYQETVNWLIRHGCSHLS